jgi:hypothetical protein
MPLSLALQLDEQQYPATESNFASLQWNATGTPDSFIISKQKPKT